MAKTPPRGKAAEKLLAGMPDEDPAAEPMSEAPPMPDGMVDQTPTDDGSGAAPMPPPEVGMPPEPPDAGMEAPDIDSALSGVEAAMQGFSEDAAREIRTHLEAIKDIASREDGRGESQEQLAESEIPQAPPDMPSSADVGDAMGMDERR